MLIRGTSLADRIFGTVLSDRIFGDQGNDELQGSSGADFLAGGRGNDQLFGDQGNDELQGGAGNDLMSDLSEGADTLLGGAGDDLLRGDAVDYQRDVLHGGSNDDSLFGGTGFDLLIAGQDNDFIQGMGGEYYGDQGPGARPIAGGDDYLYSQLGNDYGTLRLMTGGAGADMFDLRTNLEGVATPVVITDFHNGEDLLNLEDTSGSFLPYTLDRTGDGLLDATDGWSAGGNVAYNAGNNSLTVTVGDGDSVTFQNLAQVDFLI